MNRSERRAAERQAIEDKLRREAFTRKMQLAKEAKLAQKLYLERGVKLVSLPTEQARHMAQIAVQRLQSRREGRTK